MIVKMLQHAAGPDLCGAHPGATVEVPDALGRALVAAKAAEEVRPAKSFAVRAANGTVLQFESEAAWQTVAGTLAPEGFRPATADEAGLLGGASPGPPPAGQPEKSGPPVDAAAPKPLVAGAEKEGEAPKAQPALPEGVPAKPDPNKGAPPDKGAPKRGRGEKG